MELREIRPGMLAHLERMMNDGRSITIKDLRNEWELFDGVQLDFQKLYEIAFRDGTTRYEAREFLKGLRQQILKELGEKHGVAPEAVMDLPEDTEIREEPKLLFLYFRDYRASRYANLARIVHTPGWPLQSLPKITR